MQDAEEVIPISLPPTTEEQRESYLFLVTVSEYSGIMLLKTVLFLISAACSTTLGSGLEPQIPSVVSFTPSHGAFELSSVVQIVVDSKHANHGTPSLLDFANTFRDDIKDIVPHLRLAPVSVSPSIPGTTLGIPTIYLTLDTSLQYKLYNGDPTDEGYDIVITHNSVAVKSSGPLGVWWGTRTLLQQVAMQLSKGVSSVSLPAGSISDSPGWEVRGFMMDAGRHWYETTFLSDLCIYASFFKLNEIHLHASDNLWNPDFLYGNGNEGWKNLYAAFRFQPPAGSPLEGLVPRKNESWTKQEFLQMQSVCAQHGVTIIPEIDTPGHSLVFNQWKPELMEAGAPDHLNLSHPDTIPTIKSVWDEFLPWFSSPEVSIGADEYDAALANDYISFVNTMADHIASTARKAIRIWGTREPSDTLSVSTNVTIQHWDFPGDTIPVQLLASGYRIINSEQAFLYLDGKTSDGGQFPQTLDEDLLFGGAPGGAGWAPNVFSRTDATNNTRADARGLRGALFALWNDWGNNATTALEAYYQLARSAAVFGEKAWAGSGVQSTELSRAQFDAAYPPLNAAAPGQNLNRVVRPAHGDVVFAHAAPPPSFDTGVPSVGPPYTLAFRVQPDVRDPNAGVLFAGADSKLHVANLTFEATGQLYALGYVLPSDRFTSVAIHGTREYTYAVIDGDEAHPRYWHTLMDIWGEYMALGNMSFAAPSQLIGGEGFKGTIRDVKLTLGG
ncbi:glycoside hydrolase [Trametes versicolor FP-101664 SS1]|uniref:glycoside hydrolase n=1 Tax=Trametes versicolor (strain FP-101664) TaxID=717944 RepID=UPI0004621EC7|nr:glycoside hydrolase [Trametes versicolor FP-101664 SS1]EIW63852.1 glycoside hydrolase [Trametes versicolor FP-101664 SS1]